MKHTQVVQPPIANYCQKISIDGQSEPQLVQKLSLQVLV